MRRLDRIYLEITNVCNLSCPFCPPHAREPRTMTVESFTVAVGRVAGRADSLLFHLKGEPLAHPELGSLIDIAGEAGFKVIITTNGTLLAKALPALEGKKNLSRLNVSLHGLAQAVPEVRARLMASALESVDSLVASMRASNPSFLASLRLWTRDRAPETIEALETIALRYGLSRDAVDAILGGKNGVRLAPGVALHAADTFEWPSPSAPDRGERGFCHGLRDHAGILADGTVVPCCLDGDGVIALGNIFEAEWDEIMGSERARAIIDGFSERRVVEPLCRRCGYRLRFGK